MWEIEWPSDGVISRSSPQLLGTNKPYVVDVPDLIQLGGNDEKRLSYSHLNSNLFTMIRKRISTRAQSSHALGKLCHGIPLDGHRFPAKEFVTPMFNSIHFELPAFLICILSVPLTSAFWTLVSHPTLHKHPHYDNRLHKQTLLCVGVYVFMHVFVCL